MAKFKELFDTLSGRPDREEVIMQEMGLDVFSDHCRQVQGECACCPRRCDCELFDMRRLFEWPPNFEEDPEAAEVLASFEEVKRLPVYQKAHLFSAALQRYFHAAFSPEGPAHVVASCWCGADAERVRRLLDAAALIPAQVAGGHGIGYDGDCICGNIANCKRALGPMPARSCAASNRCGPCWCSGSRSCAAARRACAEAGADPRRAPGFPRRAFALRRSGRPASPAAPRCRPPEDPPCARCGRSSRPGRRSRSR